MSNAALYPVQSARSNSIQRIALSRLLRAVLVGVGITLLLTAIELGVVWLLNPAFMLGKDTTHRFSALLALPLHIPLLLLIPFFELVGISVAAYIVTLPLAIMAYVRDVQKGLELYRKRYTPLDSLAHIYKTPVTYYKHTPDLSIADQGTRGQHISLPELVELPPDASLLLLGAAGAGKTIALTYLAFVTMQQRSALMRGRQKIPIYIPLKNYSAFIKANQPGNTAIAAEEDASDQLPVSADAVGQVTLLDFLHASGQPGMRHLRPYLKKLIERGGLLFLIDGLNEVEERYRAFIASEMAEMVLVTQNRFVITCREADYQARPELVALVHEGHIEQAVVNPLEFEQVRAFVEQYIEDQGNNWQHTAGQIMHVIDSSRLRYLCTNPLMLFTFMTIIDKVGVARGKKLDTRGRLLKEYVAQLIEREQAQPKWKKEAPTETDVLRLLRRMACAARWSDDPYSIEFRIAIEHLRSGAHSEVLAEALLTWLEEHPAHSAFSPQKPYKPYDRTLLAQLLQFAQSAGLVDIGAGGILSFRHELVADYLVAEYFLANNGDGAAAPSSAQIAEAILANVAYWSEPVALWAGLLDTSLQLAERFAMLGRTGTPHQLSALALSLVCIGVAWTAPQVGEQQGNTPALSQRLANILTSVMRDKTAREELAQVFTQCAGEGTHEIYRSLIPLLLVEGVDEFLVLLDPIIVPNLLFTYLSDTADDTAYEAQVKRLCRVLWSFGDVAVAYAGELSRLLPGRSIRLRTAAINILGGTRQQSAVEPLVVRLGDTEKFIVDRSINALIRLGPQLSLARVLQELENHTPGPFTRQAHGAALTILARFLDEQAAQSRITAVQYQHIMETIVLVLTSNYAAEPEIQQQAREILVRLVGGQETSSAGAGATGGIQHQTAAGQEKAVALLMRYISSGDEMMARNVARALQETGTAVTPYLLEQLHQQPSEMVRMRIVEILKNVRDPRALPDILRLVADPSLLVQQQVTSTLRAFSPESIPGLVDLVLTGDSELVAERAAHILGSMGEAVVVAVSQALSPIVPGRTRLLVQVLEQGRDVRAIPALIALLKASQGEALLAIAVIRALSQFSTRQVVSPLLDVLANPQAQVYEEAIDALSSLGDVALDELVAALDVRQETATTPRIRRALLGMVPFPGEQLLNKLAQCSDAQAQQIMMVFRIQGADAAQVLVQHLFDQHERTRRYVHRTLSEMQGQIVVPPLLEVLNRPNWRDVLANFLLKYPETAIPPLVSLLGDPERGDVAAAILPQFGPEILAPLVPALDDPRIAVQEYAQNIIVALVHQNPTTLSSVVRLFSITLPLRAHEALLEILTNDLVEVSIPALLEGLEDAYLVDHVSEALARLARKRDWLRSVLDGLLASLRMQERRRGSETALIKVGALAVQPVGELIIDKDQAVAKAAQHILCEIGPPALSFIWAAHSDTDNRARREAAMSVFQNMSTEVIKNALVELLSSDQPEDIAKAQALLLERMHDEAKLSPAHQEMIPALLEYVQIHDREKASQRILALLFLQGGESVVPHLVQALYDHPEHHEQLAHAFLFLGDEATDALMQMLNDIHAPANLRAEAVSMLGLLGPNKAVERYAQSLSKYGLSARRTGLLNPDELTVSLRALGSLLASGDWDIPTLQNLRHINPEGSAESELYHVLLGWRYEPELAKLKHDLQNEREARKSEIMSLTARIVQDQAQIRGLESQLEQMSHEHGLRGDELHQATQEREAYRTNLDQTVQEKESLRQNLDQAWQEREEFRASYEQTLQEKQALQAEIEQLESYIAQLQLQIKALRGV